MPDLARLIAKQGSDLRLRQAIVTAIAAGGTCTIRFGDLASTTVADDIAGVHYLSGVGLNNGDTVWVLQTGGALLIVGRVAGTADAWAAFTPTVKFGATTATIVNNNTRYMKLGRAVVMHVECEISNLNGGTGNMTFTLPFAGSNPPGTFPYMLPLGFGVYGDGSTGVVYPGFVTFNTTSDAVIRSTNAQPSVVFTNSSPKTLVAGDEIHATITYEAAS